jgi:hypothetical protein
MELGKVGVATVRPVQARSCTALDYDLLSWDFLDCRTVGAGGLPSDGYMIPVM